jgi:hypothetical protein
MTGRGRAAEMLLARQGGEILQLLMAMADASGAHAMTGMQLRARRMALAGERIVGYPCTTIGT